MAVQPTPDTLWQLRDILIVIGLVLAPIGYLLKKHLDDKRERFKNARLISQTQYDQGLPPNDDEDAKAYQQAMLDRGFYEDIQQIKAKDWSERYTASLDKLQSMLANLFGEKLHFPAANKQQNVSERWFGCDPFTSTSYEFCLKLAIAYPLLFAVVNFLFSGQLQIADMTFLSVDILIQKILIISAMVLALWAGIKLRKIAMSKSGQLSLHELSLTALMLFSSFGIFGIYGTGSIAVICAMTFIGSIFSARTSTIAFLIIGAIAISVAITKVVALTAIVITTVVLFNLIDHFEEQIARHKSKFWIGYNALMLTIMIASIITITKWGQSNRLDFILLPIFIALLPLINAAIDWCSLNITRGLLIKIRHTHHHASFVAAFVIIDVILAFIFVFLVTTTVVTTFAGINSITQFFAGKNMLDFSLLMQQLIDPAIRSNYFWVHAMVLSTLIPTLLHLTFALYALVLTPTKRWAQAGLDTIDTPQGRMRLYYCSTFSGLISLFLTVVVLTTLVFWGWPAIKVVGGWLWLWADGLFRLFEVY